VGLNLINRFDPYKTESEDYWLLTDCIVYVFWYRIEGSYWSDWYTDSFQVSTTYQMQSHPIHHHNF